ncbi:MAG: HAMP domain-containing histidine kinase [Candidatus Eisenbacteria bacterium]|nr:HAMP domain-containing histidine kinase [Candidatus Eisenbacteria bacterium]
MPPHHRKTAPTDLRRLRRIENAYWTLFVVLLVLLSATVIIQYLTADPGETVRGTAVSEGAHRRIVSVGLSGLVVVFTLYLTAKRQEIQRLKRSLFDQRALSERLEERTVEMENALDGLRRANRLRDALFSVVSRDVREPLSAIRNTSDGTVIRRETERLSRLVSDLLDLSDLDSGRASWSLSAQDPAAILRRVLAEAEPLASERGISLRRIVEEDLPEILVDRERLGRVLSRLAESAIRSSPGGGSVDLSVHADDDDGMLHLRIRNDRPDFSEEERSSFFALAEGDGGGSGVPAGGDEIGFAIAHRVVRHLGGRLLLEAKERARRAYVIILPAPNLGPPPRRDAGETAATVSP